MCHPPATNCSRRLKGLDLCGKTARSSQPSPGRLQGGYLYGALCPSWLDPQKSSGGCIRCAGLRLPAGSRCFGTTRRRRARRRWALRRRALRRWRAHERAAWFYSGRPWSGVRISGVGSNSSSGKIQRWQFPFPAPPNSPSPISSTPIPHFWLSWILWCAILLWWSVQFLLVAALRSLLGARV
jgi:hypothetical protein